MTIHYLRAFGQTVARTPDATAVRTLDGDRLTYRELDERTDGVAAALDELAGEGRVASLLGNSPPALDVLLAALKRGRAAVPLNVRETPRALSFVVENANARVLVFDAANAGTAASILDRTDLDAALAVGDPDLGTEAEGRVRDYDRARERADPASLERRGEEYAVFHTSGTTGRPKGVLVDGRRLWLATTQTVMEMGIRPDDVGLVVTPLFHLVTPESWVFPHFQAGGTVVPQVHFDPLEAVEAIVEHGATGVLAVPPQLDALAAAAEDGPDLPTLRHVRTGGGPLRPWTVEAVREHLCSALHNTYGLTEGVSNVTHAYPGDQVEAPGAVGRASFNWEVRVVEAVGPEETPDPAATVDRGESGEVLVRGPTMADGYLDRPEAERDLFVEDPQAPEGGEVTWDGAGDAKGGGTGSGRWIRTDDIAELDGAGRLHVVDRVDNMIVTGGENVYPQEVETILESHPDVREAAVLGVPHERWGTTVVAVVVGDVIEEPLDRFCRDSDDLADFKRPREYRIVEEELPRTPLGKIKRDAVRERYFGG